METRQASGATRLSLGALLAAAVIVAAVVMFGPRAGAPTGAAGASPSDAQGSPASADPPSPSPSSSRETVNGLPVLSVGEVLELRAAGGLTNVPVALRGYWSNRSVGHSCVPPMGRPGELELYCHDGEYGITERDTPIAELTVQGRFIPDEGPHITPWIEEAIARRLFTQPRINNQPYPPVPIVVVGHFDDPRANDCRPEARQLCLDRFVIDDVVSFEPSAIPPPTPTPTPTPFPFDDPPPPPFTPEMCSGDVAYEFSGWRTLAEFGLDVGVPDAVYWVVVTADAVPLGGWTADQTGATYRWWGKRICYGREWDAGAILLTHVPGTGYREYADGRREPGDPP